MESFHEEKTAGLLCIIVSYLHTVSLSFPYASALPTKKYPALRSLAAIDLFPFLYSVPWWLLGLSRRLGFFSHE